MACLRGLHGGGMKAWLLWPNVGPSGGQLWSRAPVVFSGAPSALQQSSLLLPTDPASSHLAPQLLIPTKHLAAQTLPQHLLPENPSCDRCTGRWGIKQATRGDLGMEGPSPGWRRTPPLVGSDTQRALAKEGPIITVFTGSEPEDILMADHGL